MDTDMQAALATKSFAALDTSRVGYVSRDVFLRALVGQACAAGLCTSQQEEEALVRDLDAEFRALDTNGDGVLSLEEFKAALGLAPQQPSAMATPPAPPRTLGASCAAAGLHLGQQQQPGAAAGGAARRGPALAALLRGPCRLRPRACAPPQRAPTTRTPLQGPLPGRALRRSWRAPHPPTPPAPQSCTALRPNSSWQLHQTLRLCRSCTSRRSTRTRTSSASRSSSPSALGQPPQPPPAATAQPPPPLLATCWTSPWRSRPRLLPPSPGIPEIRHHPQGCQQRLQARPWALPMPPTPPTPPAPQCHMHLPPACSTAHCSTATRTYTARPRAARRPRSAWRRLRSCWSARAATAAARAQAPEIAVSALHPHQRQLAAWEAQDGGGGHCWQPDSHDTCHDAV